MLTRPPRRKPKGILRIRPPRRTQDITDRILRFIVAYHAEHGYMPSVAEIAAGMYMSRSGIFRHLDRLEKQGKITREPGRARSIVVLKPP